VVSIDSQQYGTEVLGILFFLSIFSCHLVFHIFLFPLAKAKFSDECLYWLNAVNCLSAKPSQENNRKVDKWLMIVKTSVAYSAHFRSEFPAYCAIH